MGCNKNGKTMVNSVLPVEGTTTTYAIDMTHFLCGNKKLCINSSYPVNGMLSYKLKEILDVGNSAYVGVIEVTGTITYLPYYCNAYSCNLCPTTEGIYASFKVPLTAETTPTLTGGVVEIEPLAPFDCACVTNAVSITSSLAVTTATEG